MPNRNQVTDLNQGVNYMDQGQQSVAEAVPAQPVAEAAPAQPVPVTPVQPAPVAQQPVANVVKGGLGNIVDKIKTNTSLLIGVIVGAVVLVILFVVLVSKLINPSYNVVNKYMNIMKNGKAEKIVKLYHEDIIEYRYEDEDDLVEEIEEQLEEMEDEDTKIKSFKIRECETYSKDELEDLAEYMEEYLDIDEKDVKAAKKYFVRVDLDEDGEKNIEYTSVVVVKIGNKWSLYY